MINYGKHCIDDDDIQSVVEVLRSDYLTQGKFSGLFESALCEYTGANDSIVCANGTMALHLACLALDIKQGDIGWTVPNTFVASANCLRYCQADIDFVDIHPNTLTIDIAALEEKLSIAAKKGKLPKVLIVVHFAGSACDMKAIAKLSKQYGFFVIEDAAHALGGSYDATKVGRSTYSEFTIFSFHPVKSITTGEGGAVTTSNSKLAAKIRTLASHGITKQPIKNQYPGYYEQELLGINGRLSDIQCALGLSQLKKLDGFIKKRASIDRCYRESLSFDCFRFQTIPNNTSSAYHLFVLNINSEVDWDKTSLADTMRDKGICLGFHYIPVHWHPYYRSLGFNRGDFPVSEQYYETCLSLPIFPSLTKDEQTLVIDAIKQYFCLA